MLINKFKAQKLEVIKKSQPDLHTFIITHFKTESPELQGKVAGAIIEYVIQSGGNVEVFDDKEISDEADEFEEL